MIIEFPVDPNFGGDVQVIRREDSVLLGEFVHEYQGDHNLVGFIDVGQVLDDGDYYLSMNNPNALFCCRVENQVPQIADFWPQLDMLRAMMPGKAYNWTNQANEVLRVAIEEAS